MRFEAPTPRDSDYRLLFEGDHTLRPATRVDWWQGRPGHGVPLGRQPASDDVAHRRHIGETT
jgi:hypothetical protein